MVGLKRPIDETAWSCCEVGCSGFLGEWAKTRSDLLTGGVGGPEFGELTTMEGRNHKFSRKQGKQKHYGAWATKLWRGRMEKMWVNIPENLVVQAFHIRGGVHVKLGKSV